MWTELARADAAVQSIESAPDSVAPYWREWSRGTYASTRSASARASLARLRAQLCVAAQAGGGEAAVLDGFDTLVRQAAVGAHLFASLAENAAATQLLLALLTRAPRLVPAIAGGPDLFDMLIAQRPSADVMSVDDIVQALHAERCARDADGIAAVQRFIRRHWFLVGARVVLGWTAVADAERAFSRLAFVAARELSRLAERSFRARHGALPGSGWALVALGKFGGFELTATSDLDLMLVYDVDDDLAVSNGPRPLPATQYFNQFAKHLIAVLSARDPAGALFEVDFRLRPWGNKGPIATRLSTLRDYLGGEAWTYEHMAMTRARIVAGMVRCGHHVQATIAEALRRTAARPTFRADVIEMNALLHTSKPTTNVWDIKTVPGGLIDIEFIAQYLMLRHTGAQAHLVRPATADALRALAAAGHLAPDDRERLADALTCFKSVQQAVRIACNDAPLPQAMTGAFAATLASMLGEADIAALERSLARLQDAVREIFARVMRD
jgi:glutamate-ammonia-ligase adenylyltransferase